VTDKGKGSGRGQTGSVSPTATGRRCQHWARENAVWQGMSVPVWESMTHLRVMAQ
jgi:hypothetical protein